MKKIIFLITIFLASFLRLWNLSEFPSGLNADEAALGYNAYSLLLTGKDEHNHPWPVNLESFGDFKPAGYAYILIPFIKVMGLTEVAVRLPSALFGILAVLIIYFLVKEILDEKTALLSALLLAISPWHLHYSRGGWEVNVSSTLILIGTWIFIKWTKHPKLTYLFLTISTFTASMYVYQSARVTAPVLGLLLMGTFFKHITNNLKQVFVSGLLLVTLLTPLIFSIVTQDASSRLSGVGLLADIGPLRRVEQLRGQHSNWSSLVSKLLHNRPVIYSIQWLSNYLKHFDGNFLFVNGDEIQRNKVPETGLMYITDFIFIILGTIFLIRTPHSYAKVIWLLVMVSPLASSLTFQTPHALRSHFLVLPLTILTSVGILHAFKLTKSYLRPMLLLGLILLYSWQTLRYLHEYYVHYPQEFPSAWEYGFKELVNFTEDQKDKYEKIWVTDKYDQPYILFLFYSKYSPTKFQTTHTLTFRDKFNFSTVRNYDKYHFESAPWSKVRDVHSTLIVAAPEDIPDVGVNIVKTINFPDGKPAFKIISN